MFRGEFKYCLDAKNRLRIPAKFRAELGEQFVIMKGIGNCLNALSQKTMDEFSAKFGGVSAFDDEGRSAMRTLLRATADVENDDQGRFLLPQNLKEHARIDKNVVIIGMNDMIEIWSEEALNSLDEGKDDNKSLSELSKFGI